MRIALALLTAAVIVFGAFAVAGGDEKNADPGAAARAAAARVKSLDLQVRYLRSREAALSAYVIANQQRAQGLEDLVRRVRALGFESRSIAADSRVALLRGMEALAASLKQDIPTPTKAENALLAQSDKLRKTHKLDE